MVGNAVGNGLMSLGCLLMLLPIILVVIVIAFAIHPIAGVLTLGLFVFAGYAGVQSP